MMRFYHTVSGPAADQMKRFFVCTVSQSAQLKERRMYKEEERVERERQQPCSRWQMAHKA